MVRWITIILAVAGTLVGVWAVAATRENPPQLPLARSPSINPFDHGVAALGVIEPARKEAAIVAPEPLLVTSVMVDVGDRVTPGQELFTLDGRKLKADLVRAKSAVASGQSEVDRWHALPRKEDLPPLQAAVERSKAVLADRREQLSLSIEANQRGAGNAREVSLGQYGVDAVKADLDRAVADLDKAKAGGWQPDLAIAQANLGRLKAEVEALELLLERLTVRAPRDATVLRRDIEVGEIAAADGNRPSLILGDLSTLRVRAQVDEEDIALVGLQSKAVARSRGSVSKEFLVKLVRIEPYGRPKPALSGATTERVDTRVIDVIFEVPHDPGVALYPGQAVDVFIEAAKTDSLASAQPPPSKPGS